MEFEDKARARRVKLWDVHGLDFSQSYGGKVRVVRSEESWVESKVVGGKMTRTPQTSHWWWMASDGLRVYPCNVIYEGGRRRWGIDNKAFNELTQFHHLEHCYHHEPGAMLAQMLILMLGFLLFNAYAALHSQQFRLGQVTPKELAKDLDLALERDWRWELWFASG